MAFITHLSAVLPNEPVTNDRIESVLGSMGNRSSRVKERVLLSNGIKARHYAIDPESGFASHSHAQLTAEAVRDLCRKSGVAIDDIQLLVSGTCSADQVVPNHALMVIGELGAPPCEAISTNGVCASGMAALKYASMAVDGGHCDHAVVTASELVSSQLRASYVKHHSTGDRLPYEQEFLRWMLSDAAAAVLVTKTPNAGQSNLRIDWLDITTFAGQTETCMYSGGVKQADGTLRGYFVECADEGNRIPHGYLTLRQDTRVLLQHIVSLGAEFLKMRQQRRQLRAEDIDWFLPHLSSEVFRKPLHDGMGEIGLEVPMSRWFTNLVQKGNTGSASIFVMLEELFASGRLVTGEHVYCLVPESARFSYADMMLTVT